MARCIECGDDCGQMIDICDCRAGSSDDLKDRKLALTLSDVLDAAESVGIVRHVNFRKEVLQHLPDDAHPGE